MKLQKIVYCEIKIPGRITKMLKYCLIFFKLLKLEFSTRSRIENVGYPGHIDQNNKEEKKSVIIN